MRNFLKYFVLFIFLTSCSSTWHLRRAIKKDPSIIKTTTVEVTRVIHDKGMAYLVKGKDTTIQDSLISINLKYDTLGHVLVDWELKKLKTEEIINTTTIVPPKTRQEIRQENRTERVEAKEYSKIERTKAKVEIKKTKHNNLVYWVIVLSVIIAVYVIIRIKKLFIF